MSEIHKRECVGPSPCSPYYLGMKIAGSIDIIGSVTLHTIEKASNRQILNLNRSVHKINFELRGTFS